MSRVRVPRRRKTSRDDGFTLVELLVVLGILALLAAFAGPQVFGYLGRARTESARIQIGAIVSALELYALDNGGYPPTDVGLVALVQAPAGATRWNGPYLKKAQALADPWGRQYRYALIGPGQVQVYSLGSDNARGGTGEASDISNQ